MHTQPPAHTSIYIYIYIYYFHYNIMHIIEFALYKYIGTLSFYYRFRLLVLVVHFFKVVCVCVGVVCVTALRG